MLHLINPKESSNAHRTNPTPDAMIISIIKIIEFTKILLNFFIIVIKFKIKLRSE